MGAKEAHRIEHNLAGEPVVELAAGAADSVFHTEGCVSMTPYFAAGVHNYQPCDADGVVIPGSAATAFVSGTTVEVAWPFYLITVDGANALTLGRV